MTKSKDKSEVEHLRSENRNLKKQIKNIKKQMSRKQKREHLYEDLEEKQAEEHLEEAMKETVVADKTHRCPKCKAKLDIIEGSRLLVYICPDCDYKASKRL